MKTHFALHHHYDTSLSHGRSHTEQQVPPVLPSIFPDWFALTRWCYYSCYWNNVLSFYKAIHFNLDIQLYGLCLYHLPTNWLYNFVRRQELKYFGHVTWHNGDDNNARNGSREKKLRKPKTKIGKDITDIFSTMATATRVAEEDRHRFRTKIFGQRRPEEDAPCRRSL